VGDIPLVLNCTSGKDRTGLGAGLILSAPGVPRDAVVSDYELTNSALAGQIERVSRPGGRLSRQAPGVVEAIGKADPDYLMAARETIDGPDGGFLGYCASVLEISPADIERLRANLLEP